MLEIVFTIRGILNSWARLSTQWCRNSSDLSDNRTFLMNVRQKMLECRTKCPTEIIKNINLMDEKKRSISDHIGQQLDFMSSRCFCRHS